AAYLKGECIDGEITVITRQQAKEADYNLSPSRWVEQADDTSHRSIRDIVAEMIELDNQVHAIDASLANMLAKL
ncbi:MAG: XRE family transcriptional regulator, partial [Rhodomicrobium sp.]